MAINSEDFEEDKFVSAATYMFPDEAEVARALLRSTDILCYLENEHTLAKVWQWNLALGGLRLMVQTSLLEEVHEILDERLSEEEKITPPEVEPQPESTQQAPIRVFARGRSGKAARAMLALAVLCAPAVDSFFLIYVGR